MKYLKKPVVSGVTRFTKSPLAEVEFSKMKVAPSHFTTFNAGEIVPIKYYEILPHSSFGVNLDYVIRQTTLLKPAMGDLIVDIYAYWVPNRIINESWKNVQGENTSGFWSAPEVELAPLYTGTQDVQVPPESVADYYGFPTQAPIKATHLQQCNDLKFKGYLSCFNLYFRDENFQSPVPYSKLNIYNGFFDPVDTAITLTGTAANTGNEYEAKKTGWKNQGQEPSVAGTDGSYPTGAVLKSLYGEGTPTAFGESVINFRTSSFCALDRPLKANKFHDPFTSVLPAPQKGAEVVFGLGGTAPVTIDTASTLSDFPSGQPLKLDGNQIESDYNLLSLMNNVVKTVGATGDESQPVFSISGSNLKGLADLSSATGVSINDLRTAVATQQVYEALARGGSRYLEIIRSFFGVETETPFADIPIELGHIRNVLDMYQVAQTSSSQVNETPQGNLTAFGYTTKGGNLFYKTFLEHGYVHVFAVVRQKNLYTTYLAPDNFRKSTLDFYLPQLANIGEQPIPLRTLNPFISGHDDSVIGFQEAWWEYRYDPDVASGFFRQGLFQTLTGWTYGDSYDPNFTHVNGEWLKSNAQEVVDKTLAVTSDIASQFFGVFSFETTKQLPMPVYSVPGLDTI